MFLKLLVSILNEGNMMKILSMFISAIAISAMLFVACSGGGETTDDSMGQQGKRDDVYILVSALGSNSYFYDHKMGLKTAGNYFGVETQYKGPPDLNIPAMIQAIELAVARKPGGILVVGFEESLNNAVNKAVEAGIPVVTLDSDLPNSKRVSFVGTGNYEAGYNGGMKLGELVGGRGKVALLTKVGQPNLEERLNGYKDALATFSGVTIVRVADTKSEVSMAAQAAAAVLSSHQDLAGFGCVESSGGAGCATALREAGRDGDIKVVAMDRDNDILNFIKKGVIDATVAQQTALMPFYGLSMLINLNHGEVPISSDNVAAGISGVPRSIDTGTILIDKSNCELFMR